MTHTAHRVAEYYLVGVPCSKRKKKKSKREENYVFFIAKHLFIWLKTLMIATVSGGVGTSVRANTCIAFLPIILQQLLSETGSSF